MSDGSNSAGRSLPAGFETYFVQVVQTIRRAAGLAAEHVTDTPTLERIAGHATRLRAQT